jgi:hypothetical protein
MDTGFRRYDKPLAIYPHPYLARVRVRIWSVVMLVLAFPVIKAIKFLPHFTGTIVCLRDSLFFSELDNTSPYNNAISAL